VELLFITHQEFVKNFWLPFQQIQQNFAELQTLLLVTVGQHWTTSVL
jgi:hypothetical protein